MVAGTLSTFTDLATDVEISTLCTGLRTEMVTDLLLTALLA